MCRTTSAEGRWKGKKAYSFDRKNDAVAFEFSEPLQSMTLVASIRLEALDRFNHVLLASQRMDDGNFIWQICSDGSAQLAVKTPGEAAPVLYRTKPMFDRRSSGGWYRLACVVDEGKNEVRTYLDGELFETISISKPHPLVLGDATLGNLLSEKRTATDSSFGGRIDQFMIFDNAEIPLVF